MNGQINGMQAAVMVNTHMAKFANGTLNAEDIRTIMHDIGTELVRVANTSLEEVALRIVKDDFREANHTLGGMHKIQGIKDIRHETGADLREAKQAWERALPIAIRDHANVMLAMLKDTNNGLGYGFAAYIDADTHHEVLANLHTAAEKHVPF